MRVNETTNPRTYTPPSPRAIVYDVHTIVPNSGAIFRVSGPYPILDFVAIWALIEMIYDINEFFVKWNHSMKLNFQTTGRVIDLVELRKYCPWNKYQIEMLFMKCLIASVNSILMVLLNNIEALILLCVEWISNTLSYADRENFLNYISDKLQKYCNWNDLQRCCIVRQLVLLDKIKAFDAVD